MISSGDCKQAPDREGHCLAYASKPVLVARMSWGRELSNMGVVITVIYCWKDAVSLIFLLTSLRLWLAGCFLSIQAA